MITSFFTCPRPVPYIGETLDSYFDFFPDKPPPFVFEEPDTVAYLNRTKVFRIVGTEKLGCVRHWLAVVTYLVSETFADVYMVCEDDIEFLKRPILPEFTGYASAYCSKPNRPVSLDSGWGEPYIGKYGLCGACCLFIKRNALEFIVDNDEEFLLHSGGKHLDYAIGLLLQKYENKIHYPSLIKHIGEISTIPGNNKPENANHIARQRAE